MARISIAFLGVLTLLCFSCNERGRGNPATGYTGSDQYDSQSPKVPVQVENITVMEMQQSEIKFSPPVIKKDETVQKQQLGNETEFNTEDYDHIVENKFESTLHQALSTFSIDVDEAAYSNVRRFLQGGSLPPPGAVRIEEMINYFDYEYAQPDHDDPFAVHTELAECPWNPKHRLVHIGLQGRSVPLNDLPPSNLVFLVDVSGSMDEPNKLPLVQSSLNMLVNHLREKDKVAIVVYAGNAGLVLPSTNGTSKTRIMEAISQMEAGGSTAGGEGIQLAYKIARENFISQGNNRVILATDGDFNVGLSSDDELVNMIEKERQSGVYLSVLGFGMGNYKDNKMQQLANKGNGNHSYIDNINEARKVLVNEFGSTLFTIAKDVKIQIEFNPRKVQAYRLIGYENRMLAAADFNDDSKDAGELGSGHTVTALYELIPAGIESTFIKTVDELKYQKGRTIAATNESDEIMNIRLRYKQPDGNQSRLIVHPVKDSGRTVEASSDNFRFSAAVASFGLMLRNSEYKQQASYDMVLRLAQSSKGRDINGYRSEFIHLVKTTTAIVKN